MKGTPTTWLHTAFQLVLGLKKMSTPTQCSLSQFWSPNSKKYDFEITSLSPQEKMAHKWSKWLKNTLRVYIASEWLVFYFSFSSLYFSDRSKIGLKLDNVPLCETQMENIHQRKYSPLRIIRCWKYSPPVKKIKPQKYSLLKNIHSWKISTPEKYLIPKIFTPAKYSPWKIFTPWKNIHPENIHPK